MNEKLIVILQKGKIEFMKNYENFENDVPMGGVSKPGRMTVNEYFDEVWKRVVEKRTNNNE